MCERQEGIKIGGGQGKEADRQKLFSQSLLFILQRLCDPNLKGVNLDLELQRAGAVIDLVEIIDGRE